jgi:hypothetical protein
MNLLANSGVSVPRVLFMPSGIAPTSIGVQPEPKGSIMKFYLSTLALALAAVGAAAPAFARDVLPQATQQTLNLKDGSTLYVFKDGKIAKEDRFGRATYLKQGDVLELSDGRKVTVNSNEVGRLSSLLNEGHQN